MKKPNEAKRSPHVRNVVCHILIEKRNDWVLVLWFDRSAYVVGIYYFGGHLDVNERSKSVSSHYNASDKPFSFWEVLPSTNQRNEISYANPDSTHNSKKENESFKRGCEAWNENTSQRKATPEGYNSKRQKVLILKLVFLGDKTYFFGLHLF